MGIFNELSRDFNGVFNPAENLGQVIELINKYSRIRTRTGGFNPMIYNSWHKEEEQKVVLKTVNVNEIEQAINSTTRPQAGYIDIGNNTGYVDMGSNNTPIQQNDNVQINNIGQVEHDTEDMMDM